MIKGTPNRSKVILNHKRNIPSDRIHYRRSNEQRQIQTLLDQLHIQESVLFFLLHHSQFHDEILDIKQCA